mmetsp:Transcript_31601/g.53333  ORF Transcript_31601/g.53333 Transcript_31601/m.53333 type:complete len:151 (-) Transcript_31601:1295-1747(-)
MDDVGAKNVLERLESLGVLKEVSCLLELEMQAESDIADISTSPGPIQEMQALNDTIRNLLKRAARLLEKLDNSAEETERDSDAAFLLAEADFHRERIETNNYDPQICSIRIDRRRIGGGNARPCWQGENRSFCREGRRNQEKQYCARLMM